MKESVGYICEMICERYANLTGILREKLKNDILMVQRYFLKDHWYILNGRQIIRKLERNLDDVLSCHMAEYREV